MKSNNIIVKAIDVKRRYKLGEEIVWALQGISLEIVEGEYLSIMGPSGSGQIHLFQYDRRAGYPHLRQHRIHGRRPVQTAGDRSKRGFAAIRSAIFSRVTTW